MVSVTDGVWAALNNGYIGIVMHTKLILQTRSQINMWNMYTGLYQLKKAIIC